MFSKALALFLISITLLFFPAENSDAHNNDASSEFWAHRHGNKLDIAYGSEDRQKLDVYYHGIWKGPNEYFTRTKTQRPTFIYIHGGAWMGGSKESVQWALMPFIQRGWNAVNIEYRSAEGTAPQAADDVLLALKWVVENAKDYSIDLNNLVISGDSAGGHLALLSGLVNTSAPMHKAYVGNKLKIKAIVNWFGISDIKSQEAFIRQKDKDAWNFVTRWANNNEQLLAKLYSEYSPIHYVTHSSAPVISIHGTADQVVPMSQSEKLHKKLDKYGVVNKLVVLKDGRHLGFTDEQFQTIYQEIFSFVNDKVDPLIKDK